VVSLYQSPASHRSVTALCLVLLATLIATSELVLFPVIMTSESL